MRIFMLMAGAAAMATSAPALSKDKDKDKGPKTEQAEQAEQAEGKREKPDKVRGKGKDRQENARQIIAGQYDDKKTRGRAKPDKRPTLIERHDDAGKIRGRRIEPSNIRERLVDAGRPGSADRISTRVRLIDGCPPGLAKKRNGCLPPGQAKKYYNESYAYLFDGIPTRYRDRYDDDYRYNDGYLYRMNGESVGGWLPILGGALGVGQIFPARYPNSAVPNYYNAYYDRDDRYSYRYADRAIFAVDPKTQAIRSIAALLTGDDWVVGQSAPTGYGVYNVPLSYRDRYYDTAQARYRYSDGYVYRIDPETQLVAAAISLLS